jgi:hypothetical protein
MASIVDDPLGLNPGKFALFSKTPAQTSVTLMSRANGGPANTNIFVNSARNQYPGTGQIVPDFGPQATLTSLMPENAVFHLQFETNTPFSGKFQGYAASILSAHADYFDPAKVELTYFATPEPGSLVLAGIGSILVILSRLRRKS